LTFPHSILAAAVLGACAIPGVMLLACAAEPRTIVGGLQGPTESTVRKMWGDPDVVGEPTGDSYRYYAASERPQVGWPPDRTVDYFYFAHDKDLKFVRGHLVGQSRIDPKLKRTILDPVAARAEGKSP
jgi:hypothetical protein